MNKAASLILIVSLSIATASWAERGPDRSPEQRLQRMTQHLDLSSEQQAEVLALMEQPHSEGRGTDRAARRANHEAFEAGLEEILTADQLQQFQNSRQKRRGRRQAPEDRA